MPTRTSLAAWLGCALLLLAPLPACTAETGTQTSHAGWFDGGFDEALAQARSESKLVLVDFWAEW